MGLTKKKGFGVYRRLYSVGYGNQRRPHSEFNRMLKEGKGLLARATRKPTVENVEEFKEWAKRFETAAKNEDFHEPKPRSRRPRLKSPRTRRPSS